MANKLKTFGDLQNVLSDKKFFNQLKLGMLGLELAADISGFGAIVTIGKLISLGNRDDSVKTNTWLDKLDIDDETAKIIDDTVEKGFFKQVSKDFINNYKDKDPNEPLPDDFSLNQELVNYLSKNYKKRYVAIPSSDIGKGLNLSKIKEALKSKLKQEMSSTGTGASVTPGTGEGVATKYAFGKSTNKGTPKDWKAAPSIPNRKSKAMDYKQLWEDSELKLGVKYDYKGDSGFISTGGSNDPKNWKFLGDKGKYPYLSVKADLVPSEKQPGKYDGAFDLGTGKGHHIDEVTSKTNTEELERVEKLLAKAHKDESYSVMSSYETRIKELKKLINLEKSTNKKLPLLSFGTSWSKYKKDNNIDSINENYARFRNETKTRTKPEQFHNAVKEVKKRVNEINKLFEYMNRLQNELRESEGGLKTKKYTENSLQQIKEATKQLFFKSTKLK